MDVAFDQTMASIVWPLVARQWYVATYGTALPDTYVDPMYELYGVMWLAVVDSWDFMWWDTASPVNGFCSHEGSMVYMGVFVDNMVGLTKSAPMSRTNNGAG